MPLSNTVPYVVDPVPSDVLPFTASSVHPFEIPLVNVTASSVPLPKAPDLEFPSDAQPGHETHYNGCCNKLDGFTQTEVWAHYKSGPLIELPSATSQCPLHTFPLGQPDVLRWLVSDRPP